MSHLVVGSRAYNEALGEFERREDMRRNAALNKRYSYDNESGEDFSFTETGGLLVRLFIICLYLTNPIGAILLINVLPAIWDKLCEHYSLWQILVGFVGAVLLGILCTAGYYFLLFVFAHRAVIAFYLTLVTVVSYLGSLAFVTWKWLASVANVPIKPFLL